MDGKVNIFGGFVVSQRMLDLFKKPGDKDYTGAALRGTQSILQTKNPSVVPERKGGKGRCT